MAVDDLVKGLQALDDDTVRSKVGAGDVSAAGDLDLTDEERDLLVGAADDYPEVSGFAVDMFLKLDTGFRFSKSATFSPGFANTQGFEKAVEYLKIKLGGA